MGIIRLNTWDKRSRSPPRPEPPVPQHDAVALDQALLVIAAAKHFGASGHDLGQALCAKGYSRATREGIGLALGSALVAQGRCMITATNRFILRGAR